MADRDQRIDELTKSCQANERYFLNCAYQFLSKGDKRPNRPDVEDAISTAYLRAIRRLTSDDQLVIEDYRKWFARILYCACMDQLGASRNFVTNLEEEFLVLSELKRLQTGAVSDEERLALEQAIGSLKAEEQEIFRLRLVGLTGREIAKLNGASPASVRQTLSRGYKKLREILK